MRKVAIVLAPVVIGVFAAIGTALHGKTDSGTAYFQAGDQIAMVGLGIFIALGILLFARPRVRADRAGLKIRNIVGQIELPWAVVHAVRFDRGSAWASLELHDDELVPVHAIQANDKQAAVDAVRALRRMLAASEDPPMSADPAMSEDPATGRNPTANHAKTLTDQADKSGNSRSD
jgi:hypothetical protein